MKKLQLIILKCGIWCFLVGVALLTFRGLVFLGYFAHTEYALFSQSAILQGAIAFSIGIVGILLCFFRNKKLLIIDLIVLFGVYLFVAVGVLIYCFIVEYTSYPIFISILIEIPAILIAVLTLVIIYLLQFRRQTPEEKHLSND